MKTGNAIAVDKNNNVYVAGGIDVFTPPFTDAFFAFVTKLTNTSGYPPAEAYTKTLAGGTAYGVAVDGNGCAYVTGGTSSSSFPTQNPIFPYQAGHGGLCDQAQPGRAATWFTRLFCRDS